MPVETGLYIGGQWRRASDGREIDVLNPATEEIIARVASAGAEDGVAAIDAAEKAASEWAARAPRERSEILRRAFELMVAREEEIARLIVQENGKSLADAEGEVAYAAEFFRWYSEEAVRNIGEISTAPSGRHRIMVLQQPVGISLLITPWNFPAAMATRKIGPALAAGCPVILKPASETPLTALALAYLLEEAGVPPGVVNVISSDRSSETVGAMMKDGRVRKVSFTGSTQVGAILLHQAADTIKTCSMELGGNAPLVIFDDADLDVAVEGAMIAKMRNKGESCIAANRLIVQRGILDAFAEKFAAAMSALNVGAGFDPENKVGPLINQSAIDDMARFVDDAVTRGARLITGGARLEGKGYFFAPTVLADVSPDADLVNNEIFGPIAPLIAFETMDEAIALANKTPFGLASYVFSKDLAKALQAAERIEAGMVGVNRGLISDPAAPFGGVKQSGLGREGAQDGMLEFLEKKYIAVDW
jgi:succinate-semialdehyde dehydrogenase/glutarate-semialdehyde dehydrogenase